MHILCLQSCTGPLRTRLTPSLLPLRGLQRRANSSLSERLHHELTSRRLPLTYDYLSPQPSHLLNLTLCDLLPPQAAPSPKQQTLPSITNPSPLPIGHHLIYFPPQVTLSQLLPDGTDVLHTPGSPFDRRLWAGGNLRFPLSGPPLDGGRAVCIESIRNVVVKGREGEEKVVVTIERRVGSAPEEEDPNETWERIWKEDETCPGESAVIENRDLIFMRSKTAAQVLSDRERFDRSNRFVRRMCPQCLFGLSRERVLILRFPFVIVIQQPPQMRHFVMLFCPPSRCCSASQQ